MAKSSYAVAFLLAGWAAATDAEPPPAGTTTADAAMKRYEQWAAPAAPSACPTLGHASIEEIVVCGQTRRQTYRPPLPIEREPGEIVRHAGEPGGVGEAIAGGGCIRACYQPVKIDLIGAARAVPKIIRHILGKDD